MEDVVKIASYISQRYEHQFGIRIDEMKLHKLLYFTQRESFIQLGEPMFPQKFRARRYGPVMPCIHERYLADDLHEAMSPLALSKYEGVFDRVFEAYAPKDAMGLVSVSKGQYSYEKAAKAYGWMKPCDEEMQTEDIRRDADKFKTRRFLLSQLQEVRQQRSWA